ncbi:hypothetical protein BGZ93_010792 [Podila epicladia]|nr:hypothetical protein BGZ92_007150 [Podila epicladia]KAG0098655.1 hypothetical protein BGZ93_010792 [Podila epicladia]
MTSQDRPRVIIVGAGLGGVTLGLLLEHAGINYNIFEGATVLKPLGSAIALGCNVAATFQQLGIWEEFKENSKPTYAMNISDHQREHLCQFDFHAQEKLGGSDMFVIGRPLLHDIIRRRVPAEKIHLGKRVISTEQDENGIKIHTADNHTYEGDILVGADGAYSVVRQQLYEKLRRDNKLSAHDYNPMPFRFVALVGQTVPLSPDNFPELLREDSPFECIVGKNNYGSITFTTKANTVCWQAYKCLDKAESKIASNPDASVQNAEWGPEAADRMCKEVHDLPFKGGNGNQTLGHLIDLTPKELISKVSFDEKVFDCWYSGRTVLLGDSKSKLHPAGAATAIQDAVTLANWFNILPAKPTEEDLAKVFDEYQKERHSIINDRMRISQTNSALLTESFSSKLARLILNYLPKWLVEKAAYDNVRCRPQIAFLPQVKDVGLVAASPQPSLEKTLLIMKQQETNTSLNEIRSSE